MGTKPEKESTQLFETIPLVLSRVTPVQPVLRTLSLSILKLELQIDSLPRVHIARTFHGLPFRKTTADN